MFSHRSNTPYCLLLALMFAACPLSVARAQPDYDEEPLLEVTTLAAGLTNPRGIAIRPGGGRSGNELFVADSGARRIVSTSSNSSNSSGDGNGEGEWSEVVTNFSGGDQATGPQGITFLSRNTLLVAGDGCVRGYDIHAQDLPADALETKFQLSVTPKSIANHLFGIARNSEAVYVTSGDGKQGGVFRATLSATRLSRFQPFFDASKAIGSPGARAIAFSKKGYLVVSPIEKREASPPSRLLFLHPLDAGAKPALALKTSLHDIVAIAYSPKTGDLFAADFAEENPDKAGIYRMDADHNPITGETGCKAVLVAKVDHPTALAFALDGTLYVVVAGRQANDGQLLKLSGKL